jgi:integrase
MNNQESFIDVLQKELLDKKVSQPKVTEIINRLKVLNNNYPFYNLSFLKEMDTVKERLSVYKTLAQIDFIKSIIQVLKIKKDQKYYASIYDDYVKLRYETSRKCNKERNKKKTDVLANCPKWTDLKTKINELEVPKKINSKESYEKLLDYLIANIYVEMLPRNNKDYQDMVINTKEKDNLSEDVNHLIIKDKKMIFNRYQGYKMNGQQVVSIPDNLMNIINKYLKHNPLYRSNKDNVPFLVDYNSKPLKNINSITRILNKVFGKGVSAVKLRKIYVKHKYGDTVPLELLISGFIPS